MFPAEAGELLDEMISALDLNEDPVAYLHKAAAKGIPKAGLDIRWDKWEHNDHFVGVVPPAPEPPETRWECVNGRLQFAEEEEEEEESGWRPPVYIYPRRMEVDGHVEVVSVPNLDVVCFATSAKMQRMIRDSVIRLLQRDDNGGKEQGDGHHAECPDRTHTATAAQVIEDVD